MLNIKHFSNNTGFTLLDIIFAIVILGVGFAGISRMFSTSTGGQRGDRQQIMAAVQMAQEKLEEMSSAKAFNGYSYITTANYPASAESLNALGYTSWTRTTTITEVASSDLTTTSVGSGYKRVTVTVAWPGSGSKALTTIFTNWGP